MRGEEGDLYVQKGILYFNPLAPFPPGGGFLVDTLLYSWIGEKKTKKRVFRKIEMWRGSWCYAASARKENIRSIYSIEIKRQPFSTPPARHYRPNSSYAV